MTTLKRRIVVSLTAGFLFSGILTVAVSYDAMYKMQQNKIKTAMSFDLDQISNELSKNYADLLQMTQQMTPEGSVGYFVDAYNAATQPYERSVLSRGVSSSIGLIAFSNPSVELVMYYLPAEMTVIFPNLPLRDNFTLRSLPYLSGTTEISYQTPHRSECRFSADQVVSETRNITFSNGEQWVIYVEARTNVDSEIRTLSANGNMSYVLMLLDADGTVKYSTDPQTFGNGSIVSLNGDSGATSGYIWEKRKSRYGYTTVLLVPAASYYHELYTWKNQIVVISGLALLVMSLIAFMLLRLIYRPLKVFEIEMDAVGKGHMDALQYRTGVEEFDRLFDQFNEMKQQIQQLILDVARKEKRRHELEIEKLAFQINPHFLMNALNSVHWLAVMHNQREIDKVVSSLNHLLSYNLGKSAQQATLRTEIGALLAYIDVQKMRYDFEARLCITDGAYLDSPVARFILQPIAENAICHGMDENGTLEVTIFPVREERTIRVVIQDDGKGMDSETLSVVQSCASFDSEHRGRGIGLLYVRSMLESFYGSRATMSIESQLNGGTTVTLSLPSGEEQSDDPGIDSR